MEEITTIRVYKKDIPLIEYFNAMLGSKNRADAIHTLLESCPRDFDIDSLRRALNVGHRYTGLWRTVYIKKTIGDMINFLSEKKGSADPASIPDIDAKLKDLFDLRDECNKSIEAKEKTKLMRSKIKDAE